MHVDVCGKGLADGIVRKKNTAGSGEAGSGPLRTRLSKKESRDLQVLGEYPIQKSLTRRRVQPAARTAPGAGGGRSTGAGTSRF